MDRRRVCSRVAAAAGLGLLSCCALVVFAQAPLPAARAQRGAARQAQARARNPLADARGDDELALDGVFLPPDRGAKRRLEMSQQLLDDRRFGEAVRLLGALLENSEDFFFKPHADQPVFRSLKAEAGRLIATLPSEGRESYELQFGARARQMLKQATSSANLGEVAEVSRRFFYTQAGQEATFLLGRSHLDQNRPLAAALCLEHLCETPAASQRLEPVLSLTLATCWLRAGKPEKAKETLVRLKRAAGGAEVILAGKPVKLFTLDAQALAWMEEKFGKQRLAQPVEADQWTMFRGDESRNAPSSGGQPLLSARWRQRTADDGAVEKFVTKVRHDYLNQDMVALPSLHPLAVGDVVVMRTAFALQAVDFRNGKLVWKYPTADDSFEQFLKAGNGQTGTTAQQLFAGLDQRMWEDATYGTLSSDGAQVYFIEDLTLAGLNANALMTVLPNGQRRTNANARGTNRLAARELRTQGKLKWEVGGLTGEDEPKLAGAFFLGPPLPLLGRLYALAEIKGQEIRLLALSAATGALEWSQQLAVVDPTQNVTVDGFRRNAGTTPSFADGVLLCPTSAGAVVAIDLTTRSLLWGYQYPRGQQYPQEHFTGRAIYPGTERRASERWADASITISDGRVLVTPVETDQLYCLSLSDGKELWKQRRGKHLYVGGVHRGNVILIGRDAVSAVRLADGQKAWKDVELPDDSLPSGRGFYSGDFYYLPLTTAEVAKINLQTGRIEQRARSRSGNIPGNLVSYRDSIVSQSVDYLDVYFQIDALKEQIAKTLQTHPDDPQALAGLAEVKLDEGQLTEAVDLFRRSYRLRPDEATRELLVDSLLEGLRVDFAAYRDSLPELDALIEQPTHRLAFLRLKALGLQAAGDLLPAFETYMALLDQDAPWTLDSIDGPLSVRRDRWIRAQLEPLRAAAGGHRRQRIDDVVSARLKAALEAQSATALRDFLAVFGAHPAAEAARDALVDRLTADDLLERHLLLAKRERSSDESQRAATAARLAKMLHDAGRPELAAVYYRQLAGSFAQRDCGDGQTGEQWVAELPADDPVRKWLAADHAWPVGQVLAHDEKAPARGGRPIQPPRTVDLEIMGASGPLFQGVSMSLVFDRQPDLVVQNGLGEKRLRVPLAEGTSRPIPTINRNAYNAPAKDYVSVNSGLVVLSLGNQVLAVDTLRGGYSSSNRILWSQELNDQIGGFSTMQGVTSRAVSVAWGGARHVTEDAFGRRLGSIGPVNDDGVTFQRLHDLHCVDPLTGKIVWTRKNVGLGNDLFGDDELLFVAPPNEDDTLVLRAATGEALGTRQVAPFDKRVATLGRRVLSWEIQGGSPKLLMRDVWLDQTLWSYTFVVGARAALAGQEAVGVFQPNGEFSLITLADGKLLVKEKLDPENSPLGIFLSRYRGGYLLLTNSAARSESNISVQPIPNAANATLVSGRMYAFEQGTGKKAWPASRVIAQQGMLLNQPSELPVLVFLRQIFRPGVANAPEPKISVLCVDKRTGRVVYENEQLPGAAVASFELFGDPATNTVTLGLPSRVITLTFTDQPVAPQAAVPRPAASSVVGRVALPSDGFSK